MITNKPVIGEQSSSIELESRFTSGGDEGGKLEFVTNVPLGLKVRWLQTQVCHLHRHQM